MDAVGSEAHHTCTGSHDEPDRPYVLQEAVRSCRKGGTLSILGVYIDGMDDMPMGPLVNEAPTVNTGQTHVRASLEPLLERIEGGEIDPSATITHEADLADGPDLHDTVNEKEDDYIEVVMSP